jgi:hypothetical protein
MSNTLSVVSTIFEQQRTVGSVHNICAATHCQSCPQYMSRNTLSVVSTIYEQQHTVSSVHNIWAATHCQSCPQYMSSNTLSVVSTILCWTALIFTLCMSIWCTYFISLCINASWKWPCIAETCSSVRVCVCVCVCVWMMFSSNHFNCVMLSPSVHTTHSAVILSINKR